MEILLFSAPRKAALLTCACSWRLPVPLMVRSPPETTVGQSLPDASAQPMSSLRPSSVRVFLPARDNSVLSPVMRTSWQRQLRAAADGEGEVVKSVRTGIQPDQRHVQPARDGDLAAGKPGDEVGAGLRDPAAGDEVLAVDGGDRHVAAGRGEGRPGGGIARKLRKLRRFHAPVALPAGHRGHGLAVGKEGDGEAFRAGPRPAALPWPYSRGRSLRRSFRRPCRSGRAAADCRPPPCSRPR